MSLTPITKQMEVNFCQESCYPVRTVVWAPFGTVSQWPARVVSREDLDNVTFSGRTKIPKNEALLMYFNDSNSISIIEKHKLKIFNVQDTNDIIKNIKCPERLIFGLLNAVHAASTYVHVYGPSLNVTIEQSNPQGKENSAIGTQSMMEMSCYPVDTIVWGQLDGFPPWPARVASRNEISPHTVIGPDDKCNYPGISANEAIVIWINDNGQFSIIEKTQLQLFQRSTAQEILKRIAPTVRHHTLMTIREAVGMAVDFVNLHRPTLNVMESETGEEGISSIARLNGHGNSGESCFPLHTVLWARLDGFSLWPARVVARHEIARGQLLESRKIRQDEALIVWFNDNNSFSILKKARMELFYVNTVEEVMKRVSVKDGGESEIREAAKLAKEFIYMHRPALNINF